jgi:hypothetical protein
MAGDAGAMAGDVGATGGEAGDAGDAGAAGDIGAAGAAGVVAPAAPVTPPSPAPVTPTAPVIRASPAPVPPAAPVPPVTPRVAMNRYPRRWAVSMNRGACELSPRARRRSRTVVFRTSSPTYTPGQRLASNSRLGMRRPAFPAKYCNKAKALGASGTTSVPRKSWPLTESSRYSPNERCGDWSTVLTESSPFSHQLVTASHRLRRLCLCAAPRR